MIRAAVAFVLPLAALTLATTASHAGIIQGKGATLDYQILAADVIVRGTCEDKATTYSNKHFVTTYKIRARNYVKAPGKMSVRTHPSLDVSVVGGRISYPLPLEESYPMMPIMFTGEEVILFLRSPDNIPEIARAKYEAALAEGTMTETPLMTDYRVIAMNLSKLTVVTDPKTGRDLVTRVNFDRYGLLPTAEMMRQFVSAYEGENTTMDIQQGPRPMRLPVQLGPPTSKEPKNMEEKIREMQRYTATWEDFQARVQDTLNHPERVQMIGRPVVVRSTKTK